MTRFEGQVRGEVSEMKVAVKLLNEGCRVSDTIGHSHPYDLIADTDGRLLKIQVKTAKHRNRRKYDIKLQNPGKYTEENVDLFAGYAVGEDDVFFIPYDELENGRASVTFTPYKEMGSKWNRDNANHISDYTFGEALKRVSDGEQS
jgi:hypothetical protein